MTTEVAEWFVPSHYYHGLCTIECKPASGVKSCVACVIPGEILVLKILRPIESLNSEWDESSFENVDDPVEQPFGVGDGVFCQLNGDSEKAQQWAVELPVQLGRIKLATVWILAHSNAANNNTISGVRIRLKGSWIIVAANISLSVTPTWHGIVSPAISFEEHGSEPAIEITMRGNETDAIGYIDVAYLEITVSN